MAYVVIYDACVLHDPALRDLLVRLATKRQLNLRAQWSEDILDEMVQSIVERRPDLDPARLARTKELMIESVPDCLVTGYEPLIESLVLPDPKDRHVLAAVTDPESWSRFWSRTRGHRTVPARPGRSPRSRPGTLRSRGFTQPRLAGGVDEDHLTGIVLPSFEEARVATPPCRRHWRLQAMPDACLTKPK